MKTKERENNEFCEKVNAHFNEIPWEDRPMMRNGFRARHVAYMGKGSAEVTTDHGHLTFSSMEEVKSWFTEID